MPDDQPQKPADDDENEYRSQAHADDVEQKTGSKPAGASDETDGHEKAEAAERVSGKIKD